MNKVQKRELGDTPTTVSCEICSISTPDKNAYENHVNGKKHLAKVAKIEKGEAGTFNCEFCNITVQSQGGSHPDVAFCCLENKKQILKAILKLWQLIPSMNDDG